MLKVATPFTIGTVISAGIANANELFPNLCDDVATIPALSVKVSKDVCPTLTVNVTFAFADVLERGV